MLQVIGIGFARTGTTSLRSALGTLGLGPCYHMLDVMSDHRRVRQWLDIARGAEPDWDRVFDGYRSAVDWPVAAYWRELADAYPDAKLVLTVRDPDSWYDSVRKTIFKIRIDPPRGPARIGARVAEALSPDLRAFLAMTRETVEQPLFDDRLADRAYMTSAFTRHIEQVRAAFPAGRLLTFQAADGWAPLCEFLGTPVPGRPFPRDNSSADFRRTTAPYFARLVYGPLLRWTPKRRSR
ncbi:sulfotransferase family protein [Actinoplanes aureus]|uniref:sulfotransferase family protein n=1 Tax=Actinoplanes aureus TaxID=2792083 RepID=UPI0028159D44|nr:sulfotransferase [Actinoplanes aureus]